MYKGPFISRSRRPAQRKLGTEVNGRTGRGGWASPVQWREREERGPQGEGRGAGRRLPGGEAQRRLPAATASRRAASPAEGAAEP